MGELLTPGAKVDQAVVQEYPADATYPGLEAETRLPSQKELDDLSVCEEIAFAASIAPGGVLAAIEGQNSYPLQN